MPGSDTTKLVSSAVFACLVVLVGSGLVWWKKKKEEYRLVGRISRVLIYPIKSCRGIEVQAADCTSLGPCNNLAKDRTFVVIGADGKTVTGRQAPKMLLITPSFHGDEMWLDAPDMPTFSLKVIHDVETRPIIPCSVCAGKTEGRDCGPEVGSWLDKYLETSGLKLVQFSNDLKPRYYGVDEIPVPRTTPHDTSIYTDLSTYMLMTQASVDDLNTRLDNPVPILQFRPNFVVDQCQAFDEDNWKDIRVGEHLQFRNFMPCNRCAMTTINPDTGVKDNVEPLKTLRTYRKTNDPAWKKIIKDTPMLGLYLSIDRCGRINVGDPVYATIGKV